MPQLILISLFSLVLFNGCTSADRSFQTYYDSEYKVVDQGKLDVIVKGRACALLEKDAVSGAKRAAEYHLRSVIGNQYYHKRFKEVRRYSDGDKTCVEISAAALSPT
ncbi:MAG: hypothetical protein H8E38_02875 [SAR324 cluster bacterium]|nr:hypothetical protein [SAR324 cluster bacterium]MBL7036135.1 hypothetical protein [SAR324 cluster bacterium]